MHLWLHTADPGPGAGQFGHARWRADRFRAPAPPQAVVSDPISRKSAAFGPPIFFDSRSREQTSVALPIAKRHGPVSRTRLAPAERSGVLLLGFALQWQRGASHP